MAQQYIYVMKDLRKVHPPKREVLKDIWLSFYPGAKIGVLGVNGAGKCTLLRIMAGVDKDFIGEAWPAEGVTIGYLPQEPQLDPTKDVLGNVEEAVAETTRPARPLRGDQREVRRGIDADEMDKLLDEQAQLQDKIDAANAWELDRMLEIAMDALRLPPRRRRRRQRSPAAKGAASPSAACCSRSPTCCCSTSPPTTSTPSRVAWLEHHLARLHGHRRRRHPRPLLPRQRRRLDPRARPRPGHPLEGQLLLLAGAEAEAPRAGGEDGERRGSARSQRELEWVRMAPRARQAKSKARLTAYEQLAQPRTASKTSEATSRSRSPPGPRLGDLVVEAEASRKGYGDRLLFEDLDFAPAARRHRRRHRPQRRRQDDAVPHDHRPGEARRRHAPRRRHRAARLRRPVPRRARRRATPSGRRSPAARDDLELGKRKVAFARLRRRRSTSRAPTSRRRSATSPAASATASTSPSCSRAAATSSCSTSPPTTSTSTRCAPSKRRCSTSPAAPWSSATIAGSSTASPPTSSPSKATARSSGSRATTRTTRPTASERLGAEADQPHRIRYKKLTKA